MTAKTPKLPPRYTVHVQQGRVRVFDPWRDAPHEFGEHEAGRRLVAYDGLLAACKLVVECYKGTTAHEQVPAWEAVLAAVAAAEGGA